MTQFIARSMSYAIYISLWLSQYYKVPLSLQKRGAVTEWLEDLVMVQKVAVRCEFEAALRYTTTGNLSLSTQR